jgi:hypothetical protein
VLERQGLVGVNTRHDTIRAPRTAQLAVFEFAVAVRRRRWPSLVTETIPHGIANQLAAWTNSAR